MILDTIVAHKRQEISEHKQRVPVLELAARAHERSDPLDLAAALRGDTVSLIAEIKRASPSKGALASDLRAEVLARTYAENGASAISVLTDERFFSGTLADLETVKEFLSREGWLIPVLRKEFILDPYQVVEARAHGADGVLLIVRILSDRELANLYSETCRWGMTSLVEVHDEHDIERALRLGAPVIGINNRNLSDFSTDLAVFGQLRSFLPGSAVAIAESGIGSAQDVARVQAMGARAVLVGEALITAFDVAAKTRELAGRSSR